MQATGSSDEENVDDEDDDFLVLKSSALDDDGDELPVAEQDLSRWAIFCYFCCCTLACDL